MNQNGEALMPAGPGSVAFSAEGSAQWAQRFMESGLSIRKFCAQHGLPRMSLWRWVNKVKQAPERAVGVVSSARPAFTEIKLVPAVERSDWVAELSLPSGKVLRLSKEVPAAMLEALLRLC
jgi:transposase-like protein